MTHSDENESSDRRLIEQIRSGNAESLAAYIHANHHQLLGFVRSITGEHLLGVVELDDLIQEISTTAITTLSTAPLDQYEPMHWLQQIARRRVADAHRFHFGAKCRDAGRQNSLHGGGANDSAIGLEQLLAASMTSPSAAVSRDVRMHRLTEAIGELGEEQRNAIQMRYAEGMSTKAIAEKLGKTDVAIRVLLSRSMRQLEKQLEDVRPNR